MKIFDFSNLFHLKQYFATEHEKTIGAYQYDVLDRAYWLREVRKDAAAIVRPVAGVARAPSWEDHWLMKLERFRKTRSTMDLWPDYFITVKPLRCDGNYIHVASEFSAEYSIAQQFRYALFNEFLPGIDELQEFGCGSGLNLLDFRHVFPEKRVRGMDWSPAAVAIVEELFGSGTGERFDMFAQSTAMRGPNVGVLTFHAMEQLGPHWLWFVRYLLWYLKPKICIHVEPFYEFYNPIDPLDSVAMQYHERRGYLKGFVPYMLDLARGNHIDLLAVFRVKFGSLYHDAYSYMVWRPK